MEQIDKLYEMLDNINLTEENREIIEEIRKDLDNKNYSDALKKIE